MVDILAGTGKGRGIMRATTLQTVHFAECIQKHGFQKHGMELPGNRGGSLVWEWPDTAERHPKNYHARQGVIVYLLGAALSALVVCGGGAMAQADTDVADARLHKLGRGLANIITAPAELVRVPYLVGQRDGYLAGSTVGVTQGLWRTIVREAAGIAETLTCYSGHPDNYAPIVKPEFVWTHGSWSE